MKYFNLKGAIFKEDTSELTDFETEHLFDEFLKFLDDREYSFFGETELKNTP